jgi:hypothetical protein
MVLMMHIPPSSAFGDLVETKIVTEITLLQLFHLGILKKMNDNVHVDLEHN